MEVKLFESMDQAKNVLQNKIPRLVRAEGVNICIIRLGDELIAFRNECPHMGESLHRGKINYLDEMVCPLHTYRFSLRSGDEVGSKCGSLRFIKVVHREQVYLLL